MINLELPTTPWKTELVFAIFEKVILCVLSMRLTFT